MAYPKKRHAAAWIGAILILVASGWLYRVLAPKWQGTGQRQIKLPVPLSEFPMTLGPWTGVEQQIPATTRQYMEQNFADDFISRRYTNAGARASASFYVVYCSSRPAGIMGHRPGVCYPSSGWIHDSSVPTEITSASGAKVPCLIHRFHRPAPNSREVVVLNFYVVNGQIAIDEKAFTSLGRSPNISGDPARYIAQVQISAETENPVRLAAVDLVDVILKYLPNKDGVVKAVLR